MSLDSERSVGAEHQVVLPAAPSSLTGAAKAWREPVSIYTYEPEAPNKNPMFLERRVYQGSSGKVYPLPFIDRIASFPTERMWDAVHLENEYVRLMILPEIGGRIHLGYDKIGNYDFFYRQNVIKPALVGLAGPWVSGGVEFNWPQHHRPATYMPVEVQIEEGPGEEFTVWCSDHDPMLRMKGMHGVCLRPGDSVVELKVRLYNRTQLPQTFLWWANVATRVHEQYQSFFPTDVGFVADHAKRAVTSFPLSDRPYYGVDYPERAKNGVPKDEEPVHFRPDGSYAANDLSWYANIPVPTSYMITGTSMDFFGGYDHRAKAGVVHVANHHVAPGKKQWTWGNHEFGYAWDRNLTDGDGPYIELMAGVYTDNQPDFSYLAPWETKTFTQAWYPIREMGVPQAANERVALHLDVAENVAQLAIAVTRDFLAAEVCLLCRGVMVQSWTAELRVAGTFARSVPLGENETLADLKVTVSAGGRTLLAYEPGKVATARAPQVAKEPIEPAQMETVEELYLTGVHLSQYRHATLGPERYWREALRRDPGESRCLNAMGLWYLRRGELREAVDSFEKAIARITLLNPNPYDGEPLYNLGIALRYLAEDGRAYDALYKATWNAAWRGPAYFALAEIDAAQAEWEQAEEHLRRSLRAEADHLNARSLLAHVLRCNGRQVEADTLISESLKLDLLDVHARWAQGRVPKDGQLLLDLAFDLLRAGRREETVALIRSVDLASAGSAAPMLALVLADVLAIEAPAQEAATLGLLEETAPDLCFPSRVEEMLVLQRTTVRHPDHFLSWYLLGTLLYDRRRHAEAIAAWERAATLRPSHPTVWRNLGIGYFNIRHDADAAILAFDQAMARVPADGRVLYERDQLWKRVGRAPQVRLTELLRYRHLVDERDDFFVELTTLYNQLGQAELALDLLMQRRFQPWEGGEGLVLAQFVRAQLQLGRRALRRGAAQIAIDHFSHALHPPENLSEAKHLLANQSDVYYWLGAGYSMMGAEDQAREFYLKAARQKGDFQQMSVRTISEMSFWSGLALEQLGREAQAEQLFRDVLAYAERLGATAPKIDYFATSLPSMLLFDEDLGKRNRIEAAFLKGQALFGLAEYDGFAEYGTSERLLHQILEDDASHMGANDLLAMGDLLHRKAGRS